METCKLNGVDLQVYFADVTARIVGVHPHRQLDELLLWAYSTVPWLKVAA